MLNLIDTAMPLIVFFLGLLVSFIGAFVGLLTWVGKRELKRLDSHEDRLDENDRAQLRLTSAIENLAASCVTYRAGIGQQFADGSKTFDELKADIEEIRRSQGALQVAMAQVCQKIDDLAKRFDRHEDSNALRIANQNS